MEDDLVERKLESQRRMAIIAIVAMLCVTFVIITGIIPEKRIEGISGILSSFYLAMSGIVVAYMGMSAWLVKK